MPILRPLSATLVLLTALAGAAPASAQWVGGQRSTVRRAEPPAPVAGGVNLTDYCQRRGYYSARVEHGSWVCVSENGRLDVDMDAACRDVFGPDARARPVRGSPPNWICYIEAQRPADMGEGAAPSATPGADAGVAPTVVAPPQAEAPPATAPGALPGTPPGAIPDPAAAPGVQGTVAPPILGVPPLIPPPAGTDAQAPAADAPTGPLALWTGLPFYARAVIAGLGALVLGLLLGTLLRRKGA